MSCFTLSNCYHGAKGNPCLWESTSTCKCVSGLTAVSEDTMFKPQHSQAELFILNNNVLIAKIINILWLVPLYLRSRYMIQAFVFV